jgi:hypothetical protein
MSVDRETKIGWCVAPKKWRKLMILINPANGRREKKVKTVSGKVVLVKEDHLNIKSAELMHNLLAMRGETVAMARDEAIQITDEDYAAIKKHFKPDKEILITCQAGKREGLTFRPCNFNDTDDIINVTVDFELIDRINEFIDGI